MRLVGFIGVQFHRELFRQKMEIRVFHQLIEQRVNQTVVGPVPDGSFKVIEQAQLSRMLAVHRGHTESPFFGFIHLIHGI